MTIDEYLEKLRQLCKRLKIDGRISGEENTALLLAITALGKQKPVRATQRTMNGQLIYYVCPACETTVAARYLAKHNGYCVRCGQFLENLNLSEYELRLLI